MSARGEDPCFSCLDRYLHLYGVLDSWILVQSVIFFTICNVHYIQSCFCTRVSTTCSCSVFFCVDNELHLLLLCLDRVKSAKMGQIRLWHHISYLFFFTENYNN